MHNAQNKFDTVLLMSTLVRPDEGHTLPARIILRMAVYRFSHTNA